MMNDDQTNKASTVQENSDKLEYNNLRNQESDNSGLGLSQVTQGVEELSIEDTILDEDESFWHELQRRQEKRADAIKAIRQEIIELIKKGDVNTATDVVYEVIKGNRGGNITKHDLVLIDDEIDDEGNKITSIFNEVLYYDRGQYITEANSFGSQCQLLGYYKGVFAYKCPSFFDDHNFFDN